MSRLINYLFYSLALQPTHPALVNYHLLNSVQCSEAIMAGSLYETAEGTTIEIGCDGDSLTVNGIKMVLKKDIVTTNGVIHLIDQVLIPDSGKKKNIYILNFNSTFTLANTLCSNDLAILFFCDPQHVMFMRFISAKGGMELMGASQSTFSDMVSELGLAAAMGPKTEYTLLAPVNAAFTSELFSKQLLLGIRKVIFCLSQIKNVLTHFLLFTTRR